MTIPTPTTGEHTTQMTATLGGKIQDARENLGLSLAQASRRIGISSETLANWEHDRSEPRANKLIILAGVLNVSPGWLLTLGDSSFSDLAVTDMSETAALAQKIERLISLQAQTIELLYDLQSETRRVQGLIDDDADGI